MGVLRNAWEALGGKPKSPPPSPAQLRMNRALSSAQFTQRVTGKKSMAAHEFVQNLEEPPW